MRKHDVELSKRKSKEQLESVKTAFKGKSNKPVYLFKINQKLEDMKINSESGTQQNTEEVEKKSTEDNKTEDEVKPTISHNNFFTSDREKFILLQSYINGY